jgi:hypothetical protein
VRDKLLTVEQVLGPGNATKPPAGFAAWPADKQASWIAEHGPYVYITDREDDADTTKVVLFLKVKPGDTRGFAVYGDNHGTLGEPISELRRTVLKQTGKTLEELSAAGVGAAPPDPTPRQD